MHSHRPESLKFFWLRYEVIDIINLINEYGNLDYFVFPFYFPSEDHRESGLQAISYAYVVDTAGDFYSEGKILPVYKNNSANLAGPIFLSNNIIQKEDMLKAIAPSDDGITPDYLVLIPELSEANYVYYRLRRHINIPHAPDLEVPLPTGTAPIETNPSPPATMTSPAPTNG